MKVAVVTPSVFHSFDMAAGLHRHGMLDRIFTGYPQFRIHETRIPRDKIVSVGLLQTVFRALGRADGLPGVPAVRRDIYELARARMDRAVSRRLAGVDAVVALSGSGLASGAAVQSQGGIHVCDRGSSHIVFQDRIMREEAELNGLRPTPIHPAAIAREQAEYAQADAIFTPSQFTFDTFVAEGVDPAKLRLVPYGVNTSAFRPVATPPEHFQALFAGGLSYRKGIGYLLRAWKAWAHPAAQLRLAGAPAAEFDHIVRGLGGLPANVTVLGQLPREALVREMSSAHALVLPSIEEGLALVQAQAMACGAAVIATTNTGAATLFEHGREGLIGPIRSEAFLVEALERLSTDRALLGRMRAAALARSGAFATVEAYGERVVEALQALAADGTRAPARASA